MNIEIYNRFIDNNKKFVQRFSTACDKQVLDYMEPTHSPRYDLFHGTSQEAAEKIIDEGFKVDSFSGNKAMGRGVYLTPDKDVADIFVPKGKGAVLKVDVDLESPVEYTYEALVGFKRFKEEFFDKVRAIIQKDRNQYGCGDEEIRDRIQKELQDEDILWLAEYRNMTPEEKAIDSIVRDETSIVFANLYSDCLEDYEITSSFSFTDLSSGSMGIPDMPQWIIMDPEEVTEVSVI